MATYVPVGLSYYLQAGGTITFDPQNIVSDSGKIGPVIFKFTSAVGAQGGNPPTIISYTASVPPGPTPEPSIYYISHTRPGTDKTAEITVTVTEGVSTTAVCTDSSDNWRPDEDIPIPGSEIGGTDELNSFVYLTVVDPLYPEPDPPFVIGPIIGLTYVSGITPGSPTPAAPTSNNPTNTLVIAPGSTEYIQIPNSLAGSVIVPTTLICGGSAVYITPVQLVA